MTTHPHQSPPGRLTVRQAADTLELSQSRVRELIRTGTLHATRHPDGYLIDAEAVRRYDHNRNRRPGPRHTPAAAWAQIHAGPHGNGLDQWRRDMRTRATFHPYTTTNDAALRNDPRVVLSSRAAAIANGVDQFNDVPNDPRSPLVAYTRTSHHTAVAHLHRLRPEHTAPAVHLAVVPDDVWPFRPGQRHVGITTAWLDLEDQQDRTAGPTLQHHPLPPNALANAITRRLTEPEPDDENRGFWQRNRTRILHRTRTLIATGVTNHHRLARYWDLTAPAAQQRVLELADRHALIAIDVQHVTYIPTCTLTPDLEPDPRWQPIIRALASDDMPPNLIWEWIVLPNAALSDDTPTELLDTAYDRIARAAGLANRG